MKTKEQRLAGEAVKKYHSPQRCITDEELTAAIKVIDRTASALACMGERYSIVVGDLRAKQSQFESFKTTRKS